VVAGIRDGALNDGYIRNLAGWLGMDLAEVRSAVRRASFKNKEGGSDTRTSSEPTAEPPVQRGITLTELPTDPITRSERDALMAIIQRPDAVGRELIERAVIARFVNETLAVVRDGIRAGLDAYGTSAWTARIASEVPAGFASLVEQFAIAPVPEGWRSRAGKGRVEITPEQFASYCGQVVADLVDRDILREKSELVGAMQRASADGDTERWTQLSRRSLDLETERRRLRRE
jgi:DNA primase